MVPEGKLKFLLIAITLEIFARARNGFQRNKPLVMLFKMMYLVV